MDPNHIPELGNGGFNSGMRFQDMLFTWLDMEEDCYNPAFSDEIPPDLHLLDDNFYQFGTAEGIVDPTSGLSEPDFGTETFLLDDFSSDPCIDAVSMLLDTTVDTIHHHDHSAVTFPSHHDMFQYSATNELGDDKTVAIDGHPMAAFESSMVSSSSTSTTTTTTTTSSASPEIVFEEVTPSLNVSIHVGSPALARGDKDEVEAHVERISCVTKPTTMNSKNLVSERNRRKRLSQQLLALRALVPNITKMDKRSVLVDALAYLRSIHEEIERIQEELKGRNNVHTSLQSSPCAGRHTSSCGVAPGSISKTKGHEIVQIETEKMEDKRFIVKMTFKGGPAVGGDVVQVIEDLGLEITHIALEQMKSQLYMTTVFIKVRKDGKMTEEKLKDCITSTALRSGLSFKNPRKIGTH